MAIKRHVKQPVVAQTHSALTNLRPPASSLVVAFRVQQHPGGSPVAFFVVVAELAQGMRYFLFFILQRQRHEALRSFRALACYLLVTR